MVEFGEPEVRGPSGWHKKAANTWAEKKRRAKKPKITPKRYKAISTREFNDAPCPKCYAPMRDGVCTGLFHTLERERLGA